MFQIVSGAGTTRPTYVADDAIRFDNFNVDWNTDFQNSIEKHLYNIFIPTLL